MAKGSRTAAAAAQRFSDHFASIYGERWPALCAAMVQPQRHVARVNRFLLSHNSMLHGEGHNKEIFGDEIADCKPLIFEKAEDAHSEQGEQRVLLETLPLCFVGPETFPPPQPIIEGGLRPYYLMDLASIIVAVVLDVQPGQCVADFCSAPGGKALVLAEMFLRGGASEEQKEGKDGIDQTSSAAATLTVNDRSRERKERLWRTMHDYIPSDVMRKNVKVICKDASKLYPTDAEAYDRMLVDAPCSGERHLMQPGSTAYLEQWSAQRSKHRGNEQRALLSSAIRCLRAGGRIVYSTCSISPSENDEVLQKILKRNQDKVRLVEDLEGLGSRAKAFIQAALPTKGLERNDYGWSILPDKNEGWGPIYFAVLHSVVEN